MNHFEVFGLAPSVRLDTRALEQRHRDLSLELHPDRLVNADARARLVALEKTTALNDALKVLKDPFRRACYLLSLRGLELERDVSAPQDFLFEIMERRETLEAALKTKDAQAARKLADEVSTLKTAALERANVALEKDAPREAANELVRVRYYVRFVEEVDAFEEELLS